MGFAEANSHLSSSGVRSLKFDKEGQSYTGLLKDADLQVKVDPKSGEIQYRKDGTTPQEQLVVTLLTDERDPEIEGDDGMRKFYASWRAERALKDAYRGAGAEGLEPDAKVTIIFTGETKVKGPVGTVLAKEYTIEYARPNFKAGAASTTEDFAPEEKVALAQGLFDSGVKDFAVLAKASGLTEAQLQSHIAI